MEKLPIPLKLWTVPLYVQIAFVKWCTLLQPNVTAILRAKKICSIVLVRVQPLVAKA